MAITPSRLASDLRYGRNLRVPSDTDRAGLMHFGTGPDLEPTAPTDSAGLAL